MAYTLASVRNRVLNDKLGDTSFDPDIVDNFINDTQRDIFNTYELRFQEKIYKAALPVGASIFVFPSDYQQAQSMVLSTPATNETRDIDKLYMPFREFNRAFPDTSLYTGRMNRWTLYGGKLVFDRQTDQLYYLSMYYLKTPTTLAADADVPEIPEEFQEALVCGAYYRILQRNEDFDQATYVKQNEYQPALDKLVARYGKRQSAKPMTIGMPQNSMYRRGSRS